MITKIYYIYDCYNNVICACEDEELLQEILCDLYIETAYTYFYCDMMLTEYLPKGMEKAVAKQAWEDAKDWYNDNVSIDETILIK